MTSTAVVTVHHDLPFDIGYLAVMEHIDWEALARELGSLGSSGESGGTGLALCANVA